MVICGVIWAVPWWWWQCRIFRFRGTSGSLMGRSGVSSVYPSTVSHGRTTGIEWRPWELQSAPLVVTCGVISAVVVVVVAVADSAVFWHFRWPGGLWRPLLGLSEHAEPRWCY